MYLLLIFHLKLNIYYYWLNTTNYYEYMLICALRRIRQGLMRALVTAAEVTVNHDQRTRNRGLKVQWARLTSYAHNSFLVNSVNAYNKYNLATELFENEDVFKDAVRMRIFVRNPNSNVK